MEETSEGSPVVVAPRPARRPSAGKVVSGILVVLLALVGVGAVLMYTSEEKSLAESRQASVALAAQLTQAQQETRDRQADLDGTKQQLAQAQAATLESQANGKALADQLAQVQQQLQQSEASAKTLQTEKDDLSKQLADSQKSAKDAQDKNASVARKVTGALAKAQLMDEYFVLQTAVLRGDKPEETRTALTAWFRKLYTLNDPTVDKYLDEYDAAMAKNPRDPQASTEFLSKVMAYLSSSVVEALK